MKQLTKSCNAIRDAVLAAPASVPDPDLVTAACWEADPGLMEKLTIYDDPGVPTGKAWKQPYDVDLAWAAHQLVHRAYKVLGCDVACEGEITEV